MNAFDDAILKEDNSNRMRTSLAYFLPPDQSYIQAFEMRSCSETMFLIKLTGQIFVFTHVDCNYLNFKIIFIFEDNAYFLYKSSTCKWGILLKTKYNNIFLKTQKYLIISLNKHFALT